MAGEALAACALLLAAGAAPDAGLSVEVRPPALTLGQRTQARVVVRSAAGAPRLFTSAGTLGPVAETAPGTYEARLDPPLAAHPQLALVVALAGEGAAFAAVPLVGRGVAVATTAPHARITVRIRDREFGPVESDASGVALVPVEVPPGETHAWQRGRALDLRVPPLRQLHVVLGAHELRADRDERVQVIAVAARPDGAPWSGSRPELAASAGTLEAVRDVAPGMWLAWWTHAPGPAGDATVEARLGATPVATAGLRRVAGPASRVALRLERERATAGDPPVGLAAEVTDDAGNPVDGEVELTAGFGAVGGATRVARGVITAPYLVPERLEGRRTAIVQAALGPIVDRRTLELDPAPPASVAVEVEPADLVADGVSSAEVRVAVTDRFGNGVGGAPPVLGASRGFTSALEAEGPGHYRTTYTARRARSAGADAVVARAGGLERSVPVRLLEPPRRLAATVRTGVLHAWGGFTAPSIGAAAELWPLGLRGAYGVAVGAGWARTGSTASLDLGGAIRRAASAAELWPVTATALARRQLSPRLRGFAGLGASLVAIRSAVSFGDAAAAEEWGRALGAHATMGVTAEIPSWNARAGADVAIGWQDDPGMRSFRGSLTTIGFALRVSHDVL